MKGLLFLLCFVQLLAASVAVYKQWIPNTNFENASNWDKGRIPCANEVVLFKSNEVISVFVQTTHSLMDMYLPLTGEFIMAPGAGFAAFDGSWDPGCDTGSAVSFTDAERYRWYDPSVWHAATSLEDLEQGNYIFAVDEERVPCQYDDVIFQPETSFRVNVDSSERMIHLRSISIMGQKFTSDMALADYMRSSSAQRQFHGNSTFQVTNARCPDKSGCECGNAGEHGQICAALFGDNGTQCPALVCKDPFQPIGHCCEICGDTFGIVTGTMQVATGSNSSGQRGTAAGGTIAGLIGLLLGLLLLGIMLFLYRKGMLRLHPVHLAGLWTRMEDLDVVSGPSDKGFDNPIFDKPSNGAESHGPCPGEEALKGMASKDSGVYFINPLYDETELVA
ncbi:protein amnionless isoform X3 [Pelodiscus sinensis]|uniref:protein amnionless isoform X3 n=1 Tax=Pelodiscus sinensis TaxID=13735 RepID=UPI003F6A7540